MVLEQRPQQLEPVGAQLVRESSAWVEPADSAPSRNSTIAANWVPGDELPAQRRARQRRASSAARFVSACASRSARASRNRSVAARTASTSSGSSITNLVRLAFE